MFFYFPLHNEKEKKVNAKEQSLTFGLISPPAHTKMEMLCLLRKGENITFDSTNPHQILDLP